MIAVYACGAGLGHLTRVRAAAHALGLEDDELVLLTDSPFAGDRRVVGAASPLAPPAERAGEADRAGDRGVWLRETLDWLAPDEVWIDAFPGGLRGELTRGVVPDGLPAIHLARLLQWSRYAGLMPPDPLTFAHTFVVEPLGGEHLATLEALSGGIEPLVLHDPPATTDLLAAADLEAVPPPRWLVAHAGPEDEVLELVAFARDLADAEQQMVSIVVAAPNPIIGLLSVDAYPVWPLFELVDRVITAAGFNSMRQADALALGERHRFLPFPRRFDDQFERARRRRSVTRARSAR